LVHTDQGTLDFQRYFVGLHCTPVVRSLTYDRAATAHPQPAILDALAKADLIVICPSNPYLSVAPILALPDIRSALVQSRAPIVAVSPIIGGRAVKGPAAKIMTELGITPTAAAVADHYGTLIDGYVLDESDAADIQRLTIPTLAAPSVMTGREERIALARAVITFGASLHRRRSTA
jgi:LPPG:FO 2-phospho-L-lactate transferase